MIVKLDDKTDVQFVSSPRSLAEAVCNTHAGDKREESGKWAHAHVYLSRTHFSFAICSRDLTHEELRSAEASPFFELALVLVRCNHVTSVIINTDHSAI